MGATATTLDNQEHAPAECNSPDHGDCSSSQDAEAVDSLKSCSLADRGHGAVPKIKCSGVFSRDDLHSLVGNLEKLPDSARKLFSMAKLYLSSESSECSNKKSFLSLFQVLPATKSGTVSDGVAGDNDEKNSESPVKYTERIFMPVRKSAPLHIAQTYIQWKAARDLGNLYSLCMPKKTTIYIQPIDEFPAFLSEFRFKMNQLDLNFFEMLQGFAQIFFSGFDVLVKPAVSMETSNWRVRYRNHEATGRKQYCVNDLYPLLQGILPADGACVAGVVWTDIYPEGFNFVLGEASFRHRAAVISFGRFEPCKVQADVVEVDGIIMWKLLKSLSHELCHLFGLEHCTYFHCAMNESSSVTDAMSHPLFLCPICLRKLQRACEFDVLERYQQLRQFLSALVEQLDHTSKLEESLSWLDQCIEYLNS